MKVVMVKNKKEWEKNLWKNKEVDGLPVLEDPGLPPMTYKVIDVQDTPGAVTVVPDDDVPGCSIGRGA
jgi:hypothetical protein